MNSDIIISTINSLFGNLFSSIDTSIYSALDNITFINTDILHSYYFERLIGTNTSSGILLIANSLLIGFVLYYSINYLLYSLSVIQSELPTPSQFFFKILIGGLLMNSSFFICNEIIYINSLLSSAIRTLGQEQLNININFSGTSIFSSPSFSSNANANPPPAESPIIIKFCGSISFIIS